jgi:arylsulfatase A
MSDISRRTFLGSAAGLAGSAALLAPGCTDTVQRKPNIVLIVADDLGYGDLGCYGQEKILTPNLDRMAAEGMRFTQFYCGSPVCAPSRYSLMSGLHMGHAYVRGNTHDSVREEDLTIAMKLKEEGYNAAIFGKWSLGDELDMPGHPLEKGFDEWLGFLNQGQAHFYYVEQLVRDREIVTIPGNTDGKSETYTHDLFTQEALDYIDRQRSDEPFLLYVPYAIPHAELAVPEDSIAPYRELGWPEKPKLKASGGGPSEDAGYGTRFTEGYCAQPTPNAAYAGMVSRMDRDVGSILTQLRARGLDDNTLVIFTSDNGPSGEGGQQMDFFNSRGPLRKQKGSLYEGGIRIPCIAWWPGTIPAGSTSTHLSAFWDLMPTFCDLAGVKPPEPCDGISMAPELRGDSGSQTGHDYLYWEFTRGKTTQAVRTGTWKGYRAAPGAPLELYDMTADIGEKQDVAADHPDVVERIRAYMEEAHIDSDEWPLRDL